MVDDPRDRGAYQMAIVFLGLALAIVIAGVCWIVAEHRCVKNIPSEIWFLPAGFGGVFVGMLIPFSFKRRKDPPLGPGESRFEWASGAIRGAALLALGGIVVGAVGATAGPLALSAVGATIGALVVGLLIPSPGRRDP
jgi:hypothetical protein